MRYNATSTNISEHPPKFQNVHSTYCGKFYVHMGSDIPMERTRPERDIGREKIAGSSVIKSKLGN